VIAGRNLLLYFFLTCGALPAASNDNDIEWHGVLSLPEFRYPLHPARGQNFTVDLRVFRGDITGARLRAWDGAEHFYPMSWNRNEGNYDIWRTEVAGTGSDYLYYRFEITDGSDTDFYNALGMWDGIPPYGDFLVITTGLRGYPLGATPFADQNKVVFRVWAPNAETAAVAGSFNGWSATKNILRNVQGFWEGLVVGPWTGDEYKYVFNGNIWRTDPRARRQANSIGNSLVVNSGAYSWKDGDWETPPLENLVIYELHVGSFSGEGDGVFHSPGRYRDVVDAHIDHLVSLGINAIELLPVGEFPGDRSWGYNPTFQYAPESAYGTPEDLKYLVDRCHRRGIAVILDVVYNHMGPGDLAGNILDYDGEEIYFYPQGNGYRETPWGPRLDYGRVEVQGFLLDNVRYWLQEFHLDGLRVDATDFIKVNGEGWYLLRQITQVAREVKPGAILIAEQLPNDPAITRSTDQGGAGFHAQWYDALHDNLRAAIGEAAFGDPDMGALASAVNHFEYPSTELIHYIESHDEAAHQGRISVVADGSNPGGPWAYGRAKFAAALVIFTSGTPMLLQGQEFLEDRPFGDSVDRRIQWRYRTEHADFLRFIRDAVTLRRTRPSLLATSSQNVFHVNDGANVLALHRWLGGEDEVVAILSLANNDFNEYEIGFPHGGDWYEILNSDSELYGGRNHGNGGRITAQGPPLHGFPSSAKILIPRMGVLLFSPTPNPEPPGFLRGDANGDLSLDLADAVRSLWVLFQGSPRPDCPAALDTDGNGKLDITDPIRTLSYLFTGGSPPPAPWPKCGQAPPEDLLPCGRRCE